MKKTLCKVAAVLAFALLPVLAHSQSARNLISDSSFESGKLGDWELDGDNADCYVEVKKDNAKTGKCSYKYWKNAAFKSTLSRKITGLDNGTYELSIWAMGGGGEKEIKLFAKDYDGSGAQVSAKIVNTGWKKWVQYKVDVPVKNNQVTIGIFLDANEGNWGNFDDISLTKK
jgi:hypothetical protein